MDYSIGKEYHGFTLNEERKVEEINSTARIFRHKKSGAELLHLKNNDKNKVFVITFKTLPADSTGIPHILEHSVLCGSRKFPTKEPFVELAKGSLKTFLNAMTGSDRTLYPIASTNDKDFFNLMDVYLDAVFYPRIHNYPQIFMQEGWHYELEKKNGEIIYKGVVYNEMKGAYSSPEQILFRKIQQSLFPDNVYGVDSGGNPDVIPNLTYEEFTAFHKKYYHPSNSRIFLYGDGNIDKHLQFLNDQYLKDFNVIQVESEIPLHESFSKSKEIVNYYPISHDENEDQKTYLSLNFVTGNATNAETYLALDILLHILLDTPASPLKEALLKAKIGKDVFGSFQGNLLQPIFNVVIKNSEQDLKEKFQKIVFDTLRELVKDGIDKKLIEASINITEFKLREADFGIWPKGLVYCGLCMNSWIYDDHPTIHLEYEPLLEKIKSALTTDYFEKLIDQYLLNNSHRTLLMLLPQKGLIEETETRIHCHLKEYKSTLSDEELDDLVEQTEKLKFWQAQPDSPEDLEKIPMLSLADIKREAEVLPLVEKEESGVKVLTHPIFTSGITYLNLYFDTTGVKKEELQYIPLLTRLLGEISTEKHHYSDLSNEINIHTGGIDFVMNNFTEKEDDCIYYPKLIVQSKALINKIPKLFGLIGEIINETSFDDTIRIREIVQEAKSRMEMKISQAGHLVASSRLFSYFSPSGKYGELTGGLSYYKFIADLEKNFNEKIEKVTTELLRVSKLIFNRNNLLVSLIQPEEYYIRFQKPFVSFVGYLNDRQLDRYDYEFQTSPGNEGLLTPAKVQYVTKGFNFRRLGYKYSGSMLVFGKIASLDYLWNKIRVQGGAYGAFAIFGRSGNMFFGTYRDPNLSETLGVFDEMDSFFHQFDPGDREMTKYIIGTISDLDTPLTPSLKGITATSRYISHITQEDVQKDRDEVLATTPEQVRKFSEIVMELMKEGYICVLGNENKIRENKKLFRELITVFE